MSMEEFSLEEPVEDEPELPDETGQQIMETMEIETPSISFIDLE